MKDSEYVRRFYAGVSAGDADVIAAMADQLIAEVNAEWNASSVRDERRKKRLLWKFNEKGNRIAALMNEKFAQDANGQKIMKENWFSGISRMLMIEDDREREELRKELESWE